MELLASGFQRAGKTSQVGVDGEILAHASWENSVTGVDLPTVNFKSYDVPIGQTFDEGILGPISSEIRCGGDWDASINSGAGQLSDPPGIYPRDDLTNVTMVPSVVDGIVGWDYPWMRVRSSANGTDVNNKVTFNFGGKNQGPFTFPGAYTPIVTPGI